MEAVSSEPVSAQFPCLTGKIQGILTILGDMVDYSAESIRQINRLATNSLRIGTGNLISVSGNFGSGTGNSGRRPEPTWWSAQFIRPDVIFGRDRPARMPPTLLARPSTPAAASPSIRRFAATGPLDAPNRGLQPIPGTLAHKRQLLEIWTTYVRVRRPRSLRQNAYLERPIESI